VLESLDFIRFSRSETFTLNGQGDIMAIDNSCGTITWIDDHTARFDDMEDVTVGFTQQDNPDVVNAVLGMLIMSRINQ